MSKSKKPERHDSNMPRWKTVLAGALLIGLPLIAYYPAYHAAYIWDDDDYVTENKTLRSVSGLKAIWFQKGSIPQYYPVTHTSFWIEYRLWELNPMGYHVSNVVLHVLAAFLLWRCLLLIGVPGAWIIAVLFAIHPVHVESVAWITERKNVLSAVFYLAAFGAYWRHYVRHGGLDDVQIPVASRTYGLVLLLFVLALLSKTVTCSLPAAIILVIWWKKGRVTASDIVPLLPMFVLGLTLAWVTVHIEKTVVLAVGHEWDLTVLERMLIAGRAIWFYAGKLIWPSHLTFIYPRWVIDAGTWWQYVYPLGAGAVLGVLWFARDRLGRGGVVAFLYFCGTLFPALGFIDTYPMRYSFVADHFQYLASIGILIVIGLMLSSGIRSPRAVLRQLGRSLMIFIVIILAVMTWQQTRMYKDIETLWRVTIARNPSAWMAHNNLGLLLHERGLLDEAIACYRVAYELNPQAPEVLVNIGNWHSSRGELAEAEAWFRRALGIRADYPDAYYNLGNIYLRQKRYEKAVDLYQKALTWKRSSPRAMANLAQAYFHLGRISQAEELYRRVLRLDPESPDDHSNLAIVLAKQGRHGEAATHFRRALQLEPGHVSALVSYARTLADLKRLDEAIDLLKMSYAKDPGNLLLLTARVHLIEEYFDSSSANRALLEAGWRLRDAALMLQIGGMLAVRKAHEEAEQLFMEMIRQFPDYAPAYFALGHIRIAQGNDADAVWLYRKAVQLQPDWLEPMNNLAWVLATSRDPSVRRGEESVEWSVKANERSDYGRRDYLNTLAAAHAEVGRFEEAVHWTSRAMDLAEDAEQREEYQRRLDQYHAGRPHRMAEPTTR